MTNSFVTEQIRAVMVATLIAAVPGASALAGAAAIKRRLHLRTRSFIRPSSDARIFQFIDYMSTIPVTNPAIQNPDRGML